MVYAGENPRSHAPVKNDINMIYCESVFNTDAGILEIYFSASDASEIMSLESWMLCPEVFMGEVSYEPAQEIEAWMLGEYFIGAPVSDNEEPVAVEQWMLNKEWI